MNEGMCINDNVSFVWSIWHKIWMPKQFNIQYPINHWMIWQLDNCNAFYFGIFLWIDSHILMAPPPNSSNLIHSIELKESEEFTTNRVLKKFRKNGDSIVLHLLTHRVIYIKNSIGNFRQVIRIKKIFIQCIVSKWW